MTHYYYKWVYLLSTDRVLQGVEIPNNDMGPHSQMSLRLHLHDELGM